MGDMCTCICPILRRVRIMHFFSEGFPRSEKLFMLRSLLVVRVFKDKFHGVNDSVLCSLWQAD